MKLAIVPPAEKLLEHIGANMLQADQDEVYASSGFTPREAVFTSVDLSFQSLVAVVDGVPEAVFGCSIMDREGLVGVPWMLSTGNLGHWRKEFLRRSREIVGLWSGMFPVLTNCVDARHVVAIRWLRWLGFEIAETIDAYGHAKVPFHRMELNV